MYLKKSLGLVVNIVINVLGNPMFESCYLLNPFFRLYNVQNMHTPNIKFYVKYKFSKLIKNLQNK